jgi:hypothetical protein
MHGGSRSLSMVCVGAELASDSMLVSLAAFTHHPQSLLPCAVRHPDADHPQRAGIADDCICHAYAHTVLLLLPPVPGDSCAPSPAIEAGSRFGVGL